jgi:hypothetical protein
VPRGDANHANNGMLILGILGPKRSDKRYSTRDRDLLKAIANELLIEVLWLRRHLSDKGRVRVEVPVYLDQHRMDQHRIELLRFGRH